MADSVVAKILVDDNEEINQTTTGKALTVKHNNNVTDFPFLISKPNVFANVSNCTPEIKTQYVFFDMFWT